MSAAFLREARAAYVEANARAMRWVVARRRTAPFLDTKVNPLTLADYAGADGWRGPGYVYGWIQGRGLEALVRHAAFFALSEPDLASGLMAAAASLEAALAALVRRDGFASFTYLREDLAPVRPDAKGRPVPLQRDPGMSTFSDVFVAKGLLAARNAFGRADAAEAAAWIARIAEDIERGRFQIDENADVSEEALARQQDEYGPRMIMLGAAALLTDCGFAAEAGFAPAFIRHVLARRLDRETLLLCDVRGQDRVNPGHAIEYVGFALEYSLALGEVADIGATYSSLRAERSNPGVALSTPGLLRRFAPRNDGTGNEGDLARRNDDWTADQLADILLASWRAGRRGPGLSLYVSAATGAPLAPWLPWWSLPEAIRAAALAYERTRRADVFDVWRDAHEAFFVHYWRGDPPIAYQTLTEEGPVDFVPATPDLDPGYHTGLSLLTAVRAIDRLA